jgi:tripartite-type tricarboxylate transporter receptor subunit TctC
MTRIAAMLSTIVAIANMAAAPADTARAQAYPNRPIRLVVPFPAGGPLDVMGRLLAQQLSTTLGQVIVDNRPGAGATLGGRAVATAEPDGYTLLLGSAASLAIGPALYKNIGYDPLKSFAPVATFSSVPYVMVGAMNAPYKNVPELLAYAKANPGTLNFGVPNGAPPHMLAEMFKMETKADVVVVPYKGAATVITDLIGGQIHGGFETTSVMFGHLHEGKVRGLAVVREQRLPELPDVPTMTESGLPGVVGSSWSGLLAPAGTPQDVVDKLRAAVVAMLERDEIKDKFKKLGADGKSSSPQEFAAFIAAEHARIGAIVRASGAKSE